MNLQLNLFTPTEPEWENITNEWLLNYLRCNYPDANFKFEKVEDWDESYINIISTASKRATVEFSINKHADLAIWENPVIVLLNVSQHYGNYCAMGHAVNNMEILKKEIDFYINCWRNDISTHYREYVNERKKYNKNI